VSIGDPYRDSHALAVVHVLSGVVLLEATVAEGKDGYAHALELVDQHASGRRAFAVEGTGSFGAGLTRFLGAGGERVVEVGRLRRERRSGGKTDALDAIRAARSVLAQDRPDTPRAGGEGEALRALMAAREGAVNARRAGLCQLRNLFVTAPEPLRPLPPRPWRRPHTEPGAAHDPRHQTPITPSNDRLHRATPPRRQEPPRSNPLPQALPRPQPLPAPRERLTAADLTNIEASLAHPGLLVLGRWTA
jgi:hypothetical protein